MLGPVSETGGNWGFNSHEIHHQIREMGHAELFILPKRRTSIPLPLQIAYVDPLMQGSGGANRQFDGFKEESTPHGESRVKEANKSVMEEGSNKRYRVY